MNENVDEYLFPMTEGEDDFGLADLAYESRVSWVIFCERSCCKSLLDKMGYGFNFNS